MLLLLTDQHRRDAGLLWQRHLRTPNLDRLAPRRALYRVIHEHGHLHRRATLLTGLEPHQHGMLANFERNVGYP